MNDPIVSRTIVTSDFLMNCDVVFFLSYAGHFYHRKKWAYLLARYQKTQLAMHI
ncbi:hypothetical protein HXV90_18280 [Lysinibacillus sp. JK80]|uniref:hypothetical protein n=1 Tax=Lysinibacillus sp. JK80 TaxID=2749809 RepID=UPI003FA604C9|nr:hypothetical protein HXV90_18280 [Lysinibacillus sp. JK80]